MNASEGAGLTTIIAEHLVEAARKGVPEPAAYSARRSLLDTLGVMYAATGSARECDPYITAFAHERGPCTVVGEAGGRSPRAAALANGALAHAMDFGDTFDRGAAHPHSALFPALWALIDLRPDITAERFLAALAAGGDLACRLALGPQRPYEAGGWYAPAQVNPPAAAAACAMMLGLDAAGIRNAVGLSLLGAAFPGGFQKDPSSPLRGTREAFAARAAVEAALLAEAGARSFADPLGAPGGFFDCYGGGVDADVVLAGLGETWLGSEVSFKPWPSCRGTHAYIEGALQLRATLSTAEIARIEIGVGPLQRLLAAPLPPSASGLATTRAKFSIPFTLAAALVDGRVDLATFAPAKLADPRILALAERVEARSLDEWPREEAARGDVAIITRSGERFRAEIAQALGCPANPLSDEDLTDKFATCLAHAADPLGEEAARRMAARILTLPVGQPARAFFGNSYAS